MVRLSSVDTGNVDSRAAVAAASYIVALSQILINVQPLILGAIAEVYQLGDRQLGHLSAVFIGFATLGSLTGPAWVRKVDWRRFTLSAVFLAVLALCMGALLDNLLAYMIQFAVLGVLMACISVPAFAGLGDTANPDRNYGISVAVQSLIAAISATVLASYIIPHFGIVGQFLGVAAVVGTGAIACYWLPRTGSSEHVAAPAGEKAAFSLADSAPVILALIGLGLFVGGILGFWYFVERIGSSRGASVGLVGLSVSFSALATICTSTIVAWLGGRVRSIAFIFIGTLLVLIGFAALQLHGDAPFVAAVLLFALGWGLAQPAYWSVTRRVDATNRLFVAGPAIGGVAGVAIGIAAGPLIERGGYDYLIMISGGLLVAGAVCAVLALLVAARREALIIPDVATEACG